MFCYDEEVLLFFAALAGGLGVLIWSSDRFVFGASGTAHALGMSPLLIGMLVVGFGTSAPEMIISAISALDGAPGIALGNAWGSNIANVGLILGISALVKPVRVRSSILRVELPILAGATALAATQVLNGVISQLEGLLLLFAMAAFLWWSVLTARRSGRGDPLETALADSSAEEPARGAGLRQSIIWLLLGLLLLVASSRVMVWGAVGLATAAGVSELVIGLTIIAVGTSLPELASTVAAVRRGEDDIAVGNVLGSNMFNTLAVVGIAAIIQPVTVEPVGLTRDLPVMAVMTLALFAMGFAPRGRSGSINRVEAGMLLFAYVGYTVWVGTSALG